MSEIYERVLFQSAYLVGPIGNRSVRLGFSIWERGGKPKMMTLISLRDAKGRRLGGSFHHGS